LLSGIIGVQMLEKLCPKLFCGVRIVPAKSSETFPPQQDGTETLVFAEKNKCLFQKFLKL